MTLTVCSVFRNATAYIDRYAAQVRSLSHHTQTRVVAVYGDSHDRTGEMLHHELAGVNADLVRADHGGPTYPSVDHPARWRQLAAIDNVALAVACRVTNPEDTFCFIEADLIWHHDDICALIADLALVDAVAPMSFTRGRFYDVWGYRKDGIRFGPYPPYHFGVQDTITEIDSSGSCFVTRGDILPCLQFSPVDCIIGIGRSLREHGYSLHLDPNVRVEHP